MPKQAVKSSQAFNPKKRTIGNKGSLRTEGGLSSGKSTPVTKSQFGKHAYKSHYTYWAGFFLGISVHTYTYMQLYYNPQKSFFFYKEKNKHES